VQLTSFYRPRRRQIDGHAADPSPTDRLVTLTGAGWGRPKTRACHPGSRAKMTNDFSDGVWYVDLAPIADPDPRARRDGERRPRPCLISPVHSPTEDARCGSWPRRRMLVVLDNCEHLLDAIAELTTALVERVSRVDTPGNQPRADRGGGRGDLAGAVPVRG